MTVTKALRTCVPFNCVGRLDSCLRELVVGYQVKALTAVRAKKTLALNERGKQGTVRGLRMLRARVEMGVFSAVLAVLLSLNWLLSMHSVADRDLPA